MTEYRYWKDGDLDIRTCPECCISECHTPGDPDDDWFLYFTKERHNWYAAQLEKGMYSTLHCENCTGREKPYVPKCHWCHKSEIVADFAGGYICEPCYKRHRENNIPFFSSSPISDTYMKAPNVNSCFCDC